MFVMTPFTVKDLRKKAVGTYDCRAGCNSKWIGGGIGSCRYWLKPKAGRR
jgi:hypothetical protein